MFIKPNSRQYRLYRTSNLSIFSPQYVGMVRSATGLAFIQSLPKDTNPKDGLLENQLQELYTIDLFSVDAIFYLLFYTYALRASSLNFYKPSEN